MELRDLIKLNEAIKREFSPKTLRAFGLKHPFKPIKQLKIFLDKLDFKEASKVEESLNRGVNIAIFVSLIFGFITGVSLLKFGANGFVNISYFIFFASIIPLILGIVTLIYIFKKPSEIMLPSSFLQKIISYFSKSEIEISKDILYYFNLKSASLFSLFFSIGLLLALILVGIGSDLPFKWSTTANISESALYNFLKALSAPIPSIEPPAIEVIKNSKHISSTPYYNPSNGQEHNIWWKFLIALTLFYGVFFRGVVYLIAKLKYHLFLNKKALEIGKELIDKFNTPLITTHNQTSSTPTLKKETPNIKHTNQIKDIDAALGWAMDEEKILLLKDKINFSFPAIYSVGGLQSFAKDLEIIKSLKDKRVVLFVNSYEAPTLDFIDFLEELSKEAKEVVVYLVGAKEVKEKEYNIWAKKIASYNFKNVSIKGRDVS